MADMNHKATGHERIETSNFLMIVLIIVAVAFGGLVEIVPLFFQRSTTQPAEGLKPYTALQLAGRCATATTARPASSSTTGRSSGAASAPARIWRASAGATRTNGIAST